MEQQDLTEWVDEEEDPSRRVFRVAVHTVLVAIAQSPDLNANMIIKGGILLAIRYKSSRYTKDIDFSTPLTLKEFDINKFEEDLNNSLISASESLEYGLDCRVQSCKIEPKNQPDASFPSVEISIGYAYKGSNEHKRLMRGQSPHKLEIDYSLNEYTREVEKISVNLDREIQAYSFVDLVAEKIRAILQQEIRNRFRRQDVYDLYLLFSKYKSVTEDEKVAILDSLIKKAESRGVSVTSESMKNEEIKNRSKERYPTLADEVEGELPDFDDIYQVVKDFYESLPWSK